MSFETTFWQTSPISTATLRNELPKVSEWNIDDDDNWYRAQDKQSSIYDAGFWSNKIFHSVGNAGVGATRRRIAISFIALSRIVMCGWRGCRRLRRPALDMMISLCHEMCVVFTPWRHRVDAHKHQQGDDHRRTDVWNGRFHYRQCTGH